MFNISRKRKELLELENKISEKIAQIDMLNSIINKSNDKIAALKDEIGFDEGIIKMQELGNEYIMPESTSNELSVKLGAVKDNIAKLIADDGIYSISRQYRIDGSVFKGEQFQKAYIETLIIGLNAYIATKQKSITEDNCNRTIQLIDKTYRKYQAKAEYIGASISDNYYMLKMDELKLMLDIKIVKEKEKAEIRENKRKLKEQEKLLEEAAKERKRLENEKKAMDIAFAKALTDSERDEIKKKLDKIDKRIADVDYRVNNAKAGWLYVISSPSLPGLVKIGCTRRLSPMVRVKELSSASLPESFCAHGFVFSDDCFALESAMHKYFDKQRINPDREFFSITPNECIHVLKDVFKVEVNFEDVMEETE